MFTGIVRAVGRVLSCEPAGGGEGRRLTIAAPDLSESLRLGDSIAVSGVCLTAVVAGAGSFGVDVVPETLRRTTLGRLASGDRVNLEPCLTAADPLGGHVVQGHVDGTGRVTAMRPEGGGYWLEVALPPELQRYVAHKGAIAIDGVSLTVAALRPDGFAIALIPHTAAATTLGALQPGDPVNIETDVLARYVERLLQAPAP